MGMRIAVTGGLGFIGTEIVEEALRVGLEVIVVDFSDRIGHYETNRYPIIEKVYANLPRCARLVEPWKLIDSIKELSPQVIIHAGACVDTTDLGSPNLIHLNLRYTEQLAERADEAGAHIVFASSAATYGRGHGPINPYGLTKAMGETAVRATKLKTRCLRYFNVFGKNEHHKGKMASLPFKLAQAYRTGDRFDLHSPDASRDFVPVSTVARVTVREAIDVLGPLGPRRYHEIYDVGTGRSTTLRDLDNFVMQALGSSRSIVREVPMPKELEGRYQGFTCAGNSGTSVLNDGRVTRDGLEEMYGKR